MSSGPGPVDTPTVMGLHSRTVSVTWAPPSQTNGIITNYTLYLHPGSFISSNYKSSSITVSSLTLSPNPFPNLSTLFSKEKSYLDSDSKTLFNLSRLQDSVSLNDTSLHNGSSAIQNTSHTLNDHFSTLMPRAVEGSQTEPSHQTSTSPDQTTVLFYPEELNATSGNPNLSLSSAKVNANSYNPDLFIKQDPFASPISSSLSTASRSKFLSVTVPGNITSYTFFNLLPYRTYSLQVLLFTTAINVFFMVALFSNTVFQMLANESTNICFIFPQ